MLKKIAAALLAATLVGAPLVSVGTAEAASKATTQTATPAKPAVKTVKTHRKHVRHVRHAKAGYVKVVRHGKVMYVKAHGARHHVKLAKKPTRPLTRQGTKSPARAA